MRVLQEALQNTVKHATADNIYLSVTMDYTDLHVGISDDGIGFSFGKMKHRRGIDNIYKEIKQCGGETEILSEPGKGTHIQITIPLQKLR
jgi:signal transduction histidine kinase